MNFDFSLQVNPFLEKLDFNQALSVAESALAKIPKTDFHFVLGNNFSNKKEKFVNWISNFYNSVSSRFDCKALYFEINEFDINTDRWYITGFSFSYDGGSKLSDMDWLCDVTPDNITEDVFMLTGFEKLQKSFRKFNSDTATENQQLSRDWCEQIIIIRFMELIFNAHEIARANNLKWASIPLYFTEHGYDFIVKSEL